MLLGAALGVVILAGCTSAPAPPAMPAGFVPTPPPTAPPPPVPQPPAGLPKQVFDATNAARAANGLGPLVWDQQLYDLANAHSIYMASTFSFVHQNLSAILRSPGWEGFWTLGENILNGSNRMTGQEMVNLWMSSAGHRANILNPNFNVIGIGFGWSSDGRVWSTQDFGGR
jgi:uncharacterized protein YkwD